ncbi:25470_t:CDS:2, partial [Dentiscutata erythropus]
SSEETITSILSLYNEDKSSILENLENRLATTYKVEVNIQKQLKKDGKFYESIVNHFDETSDIDHEMLITVFKYAKSTTASITNKFLDTDNERTESSLFNYEASKHCYRSEIVNLCLRKNLKMIECFIWLESGEIANEIQKMQRNDTKKPRHFIKSTNLFHLCIINNGLDSEDGKVLVAVLDSRKNAFNNDIIDRNIDLEKLYK